MSGYVKIFKAEDKINELLEFMMMRMMRNY